MFTGLVEELGTVEQAEAPAGRALRLVITATKALEDIEVGASVAVNGCCLSVVEHGPGWWSTEAVPETLERTTLGTLRPGDLVNLERPLRLGDRLGGHLVQGHVDATVEVLASDVLPDGSARLAVRLPANMAGLVVEKGSIALDGVSLTIAAFGGDERGATVEVALIPHTRAVTTLGQRRRGDRLNLEVDVLAKHVAQLVAPQIGAHLDMMLSDRLGSLLDRRLDQLLAGRLDEALAARTRGGVQR